MWRGDCTGLGGGVDYPTPRVYEEITNVHKNIQTVVDLELCARDNSPLLFHFSIPCTTPSDPHQPTETCIRIPSGETEAYTGSLSSAVQRGPGSPLPVG